MYPVSKTAFHAVYAQWPTNITMLLHACELYNIYVWKMAWVVSNEHTLPFLS